MSTDKSGSAPLVAAHLSQIECDKLNSDYSLWGAVAKGLAALAGATPALGIANGVAAIVGASSASVAFYADTRTELYIKSCTKPEAM